MRGSPLTRNLREPWARSDMTYSLEKMRRIIAEGGHSAARGEFAILLPFVMAKGELSLLFETRAMNMRRQPGEVCFPGGRIEAGESPAGCAVRECFEEVGIPQSEILVTGSLGSMKSLLDEDVNIITGEIRRFSDGILKINPEEVHEVFTVPFEWLVERGGQTAFNYHDHYIWGLTARAVNMMIKLYKVSE